MRTSSHAFDLPAWFVREGVELGLLQHLADELGPESIATYLEVAVTQSLRADPRRMYAMVIIQVLLRRVIARKHARPHAILALRPQHVERPLAEHRIVTLCHPAAAQAIANLADPVDVHVYVRVFLLQLDLPHPEAHRLANIPVEPRDLSLVGFDRIVR